MPVVVQVEFGTLLGVTFLKAVQVVVVMVVATEQIHLRLRVKQIEVVVAEVQV